MERTCTMTAPPVEPITDADLAEIIANKGLTEYEPGCLYPLNRQQAMAIIARLRVAEAHAAPPRPDAAP